MDELNDIVFSKTFKAPSAWADRERKYKMDARDWDVEVRELPESSNTSAVIPRVSTSCTAAGGWTAYAYGTRCIEVSDECAGRFRGLCTCRDTAYLLQRCQPAWKHRQRARPQRGPGRQPPQP